MVNCSTDVPLSKALTHLAPVALSVLRLICGEQIPGVITKPWEQGVHKKRKKALLCGINKGENVSEAHRRHRL